MHKFTSVQHLEDSIKEQKVSLAQLDAFVFRLNWATRNYDAIFTQDMYDIEWKVLTWWNAITGFGLEMTNKNRYKHLNDTKIEFNQDHLIRHDITYQE
jgi:hypothetical protein